MLFTLKDYQDKAVREVLKRLAKAKRNYDEDPTDLSAFALSATTGAGKTVIASAVIEALFRGSIDFDADPDPKAAVLWVTDDRSLNEQTKYRIDESADRIGGANLVIINEKVDIERFEPGKVYFLNIQKLAKTSTYGKTKEGGRRYSIWTTIKNTVESDKVDLCMVLDEAHRGMKSTRETTSENTETIVQRIINGHDDIPPIPVVWGISATIERFTKTMAAIKARNTLAAVDIDPKVVQASGLLKDVILLDAPNEDGDYSTTLLREATAAFVESDKLWADYCAKQGIAESVVPLMVVQVPNMATDADLSRFIDTIREEWPGFDERALAHVFGERDPRTPGKYTIEHIEPQDVQDSAHVRILFAKDAVTTGWDCPRAEVLFSMRPATDRVHIMQLLGRMVRTPLGERIPSDERLNSVTCFLPKFDRKKLIDVADRLMGKADDLTDEEKETAVTSRKVLLDPVGLTRNANVDAGVVSLLEKLPSLPKPQPDAKPVKRMVAMATELAIDKFETTPKDDAFTRIFGVLDGKLSSHKKEIDAAVVEIHEADITRVKKTAGVEGVSEESRKRQADQRAVDDRFRVATRRLGPAIANGMAKRLATKAAKGGPLDFFDAKARVAALVDVEGVVEAVDTEADTIVRQWFATHDHDIKLRPDSRKERYSVIRGLAREPEHRDTEIPTNLTVEGSDRDGNKLETAKLHVLADVAGAYPIGDLKTWEQKVVRAELSRKSTVGWYRNPSNATAQAIQVPYKKDGRWAVMLPDFVFVAKDDKGDLHASIVDPHGDYLTDAVAKLQGLASYAKQHGASFLRISAVAENSKKEMVSLDLLDAKVQAAIATATSAKDLYNGPLAAAYK